jgi:hypothetical protein
MMQYQKAGTYYEDALGVVTAQFVNSGYVQFSESNGYRYFHVFGDPEILIPEVDDLVTAQTERNLHVGALGTADYDIVNHVSSVNEPFLVTEVEQVGDAIWIKVAF